MDRSLITEERDLMKVSCSSPKGHSIDHSSLKVWPTETEHERTMHLLCTGCAFKDNMSLVAGLQQIRDERQLEAARVCWTVLEGSRKR